MSYELKARFYDNGKVEYELCLSDREAGHTYRECDRYDFYSDRFATKVQMK